MADRTYVEDVKDSIEIQLPASNLLLIVLRVEQSRDRISSALLDDLPLNFGHSSTIERLVCRCAHGCFSSRSQLLDCLKHGLTEFF